jgi:hypothetical protein
MAHPFTAIPLGFAVMGQDTLWCVTTWLERTRDQRGYVMDLLTLWRLASGWYAGRLERSYARREPSAAADYLRRVGLSGAFWGPD